MATVVPKSTSEAEAYLAEGAREISERLQDLLSQHRRARPRRSDDLIRAAAEHPIAAGAALVIGAVLALFLADRLIPRPR